MSHELQLIVSITVAVATALVGGLLAHALRQSPIVGYLAAGIAIGPFTPGFVGDRANIAALAEIGVIFLMFALGIEFSLRDLAHIKRPAILGTLLQVTLLIVLGIGFGAALGWPVLQGFVFGCVIAVSSTMVILKTLMHRDEVNSSQGRLLLGMLIVQDLAVVVLILLLPKLAENSGGVAFELSWVALKALAFIGVTILLGTRVVPPLMARVGQLRSPELFLLTAVALGLGTAMVSALLGLSPALGAFMAGLLLTETEFEHRVIAELIPMRDLFATLFFVSIGMLIDVHFLLGHLPAVLGLALFIMLAKASVTAVSLLPFRIGGKTIAFTALGMIPIGEFNFVLAQVGQAAGAIPTELYNLILSSSLITILLTPGAFWIAPRVDRALSRLPLLGRLWNAAAPAPQPVGGMQDHAIVVGYGRVGRRMARGLRQAGLPVLVIEQDLTLFREITERGTTAIYGDASRETVLAAAHPETARVIVVALPDFGATRAVVQRARRANPDTLIVARAQRTENDVKLREAGATAIVVPEIAGSIMLLEETLILLGLPTENIFKGVSELAIVQRAADAAVERVLIDEAKEVSCPSERSEE